MLGDTPAITENVRRQYLLSDPWQTLFEKLRTGPGESFARDIDCGP